MRTKLTYSLKNAQCEKELSMRHRIYLIGQGDDEWIIVVPKM